jgi:large subunit ribosomal protein L23
MVHSILIKPLVSEKSNMLTEKYKQYGFIVDRKANKKQIKEAIEKVYNVEVAWVNTIVKPSKNRINPRTRQVTGRSNIHKKAIFALKEGFDIDFYETKY